MSYLENDENLTIVSGDGSNLNISPVYEHIDPEKPKTSDKKPTHIVIPEEQTNIEKKETDTSEKNIENDTNNNINNDENSDEKNDN